MARNTRKKVLKFKQRRAISLLTAYMQDEKIVADEVGVKLATLRKWMQQDHFKQQLEASMQRIEAYDARYRTAQNKSLATQLYDEAHRRVAMRKDIMALSFPALMKQIQAINHEVRIDTGEATGRSKVEHEHKHEFDLDMLIQRFKDNEAGDIHPHLRLVESPAEDEEEEEKEAASG